MASVIRMGSTTRTRALLALGSFLAWALLSTPAAATPQLAKHTASTAAPHPRRGTAADIERYRAREAASPGAREYRGGDGVMVIGASAITLAAAVVLLVVLL